jgi:chaperonin GroEL (HSP60 family)
MGFLEYANKTTSNVIPKEEFNGLIHEVFETISTCLEQSLGPLGSSTTILDGMLTSATKDGHAIFKSLRFNNRYKRMIYNLIAAVCTRLNNVVGDGTTTAIVLTNELFHQYQLKQAALETYYRLPRSFIQAWDAVIESLLEKIKTYATPINSLEDATIFNLCYVTSNGNMEVSTAITETYKTAKAPVIKMKDSPTNKSYIVPITGFEFPANLIDQAYVKSEDLSTVEKDVYVMLFNYKIDAELCNKLLIPINEVLKQMGHKLLVIAPYFDALLANTTLKQYLNYEYQKHKSLNLILAQYSIDKLEPFQFEDLAVVLRTNSIDQEMGNQLLLKISTLSEGELYDFVQACIAAITTESVKFDAPEQHFIGSALEANLSCTNGSIFRVVDLSETPRYLEVLRQAKKELIEKRIQYPEERQAYAFEIAKAQARVSQLEMKNYIYYIGADSLLQRGILKDAVDDVIKCVRSATKSGTVPGCQLSLIRACTELMNVIATDHEGEPTETIPAAVKLKLVILELIQTAVLNLYAKILHGPNGTGILKTIPLWNHIDTTKEEAQTALIKTAQEKCNEIIKTSIQRFQVCDLETLEYSDAIITSAETDSCVLLAASELVKLLISGNQSLFLDAEVNESHQETFEAYV